MMNFAFSSVGTLHCEFGAARNLARFLPSEGVERVLIVTDKGVMGAGLVDASRTSLETHGIAVEIFDEITPDPPEAVILRAAERARAFAADAVVGIGGGSTLDSAKLAALLARSQQPLAEAYGIGLATGSRLPLVLVPTTAGTGSEVTPIAIVTTPTEEKKGVVSPLLLPDAAVLDAELTLTLPSHITAYAGVDAMVHAIEAFTTKRLKNPMSDSLAIRALQLMSGSILTAFNSGTSAEAREAMLLGSCMAGLAFANAPVAAVHALAYPLGGRLHVPHGLSNALMLPHVLEFNADAVPDQYDELCNVIFAASPLGPPQGANAGGRALASHFRTLSGELALESRLREVGVAESDLDMLAQDAMQQQRLLINNPRDLDLGQARALYAQAL